MLWLWCFVIPYSNVASSFDGAFTFSPPSFSPCNIDPSNDLDHEDHMIDDALTFETYLPIVYSKLGIKKGNYNVIKMFQDFWVAKLPWTWLSLGSKGNLYATKCKICSVVERKNKLFVPKWDSICKHARHMKANKNIGIGVKKRDRYYSNVCKHAKNWKLHASYSCESVVARVVNGLVRKKARKVCNLSQYCICCSKDIPWWDMIQWSLYLNTQQWQKW